MSMPGERLGDATSPVMKLILAMEQFGRRFPGFERETHGVETDEHGKYWMRAVIESPEQAAKKGSVEVPDADPQKLDWKPIRRSTS